MNMDDIFINIVQSVIGISSESEYLKSLGIPTIMYNGARDVIGLNQTYFLFEDNAYLVEIKEGKLWKLNLNEKGSLLDKTLIYEGDKINFEVIKLFL